MAPSKIRNYRTSKRLIPAAPTIPEQYICPLTLEIMTTPVMTITGFNFERQALGDWMNKSSGKEPCCPMTRKPLKPADVVTNRALQQQIRGWKRLHGYDSGEFTVTSATEAPSDISFSEENEDGDDLYSYLMFDSEGLTIVEAVEKQRAAKQLQTNERGKQRHKQSNRKQGVAYVIGKLVRSLGKKKTADTATC